MCDVPHVRVIGRVARLAVAAALVIVAAWRDAAADAAPVDDPARAERVERARLQVLDDSYQPDLPLHGGASQPNRKPGEIGAEPDRRMVDSRYHDEPGAMSSLMSILLWGMIIVVAVLAASWLASELAKYGGDAELPPEADSQARLQAAADAIIELPLGDADELARRGLYAEAIHTLLLRTLQELVRGAAVRVAPAMTSREILARVPLLADARTALAGLITAVEITHFGDEPANAADYERCRQQFHVFATAFRGAGQRAQAVAA